MKEKIFNQNQVFKILIVDDTIYNILGLKMMLKNVENLTFDQAFNG